MKKLIALINPRTAKKESSIAPLLRAISFSARAHRNQFRKDGITPYVSHPFRVCMILRHIFGVTDERILIAAVLHDTIEDTTTDFDDVEKEFGKEVAEWVALLSKDKREEEGVREKHYVARLRSAPDAVKLSKLADIYDNLSDVVNVPSRLHHEKTLKRTEQYLDALSTRRKSPTLKRALAVVLSLRKETEKLL